MSPISFAGNRAPLVIFGAFLGCALAGIPPLTIGPLFEPLHQQFGWNRTQISTSMLITSICITICFPFIGLLLDRLGSRKLAIIGLPLCALSLASIGLVQSIWAWYGVWAAYAIITSLVSPLTWTAAVAQGTSRERRGFAMAVALAGSSAMAIVVPGATIWIEREFGWQTVFFLFACFPLLIVWPAAWLTLPHRAKASGIPGTAPDAPASGYAEIIKRKEFLLLAITSFANALCVGALMLHFVPMLARFAFEPAIVAVMAGLFGPAALTGRLGVGVLLASSLPRRLTYVALIFLPALAACLMTLGPVSPMIAAAAIIAIGLCQGASMVFLSYFNSVLFTLAEFGRVGALITGLFAIGFGIGPVLAGALYDGAHSYLPVALMVLAVSAAATLPAAMVGARADVRIAGIGAPG